MSTHQATIRSAAGSTSVSSPSARLHRVRRFTQYATIIVLVLVPVSGLFRIDPLAGAFVVLDKQVWFSDFFIVIGFWITAASLLVVTYSLAGQVFCGWVCPQGTVSEWANQLTKQLLGRQAESMDLSGKAMQIASRKDTWLNRVALGSMLFVASLLYAVIPLLYFYPPEQLWQVVTLRSDQAGSVLWIYAVFVVIMFLDIAVIRHMMCRYMCIYRMWQHSFKTRDTLHVSYDQSRSDHCTTCSYCASACFLELDPRRTDVYDSCINCGECIVACDELHVKSRKWEGPGLLRFELGDKTGKRGRGNVGSFASRARVAFSVAALGGLMLFYGLTSYEPQHLSVFRAETRADGRLLEYQINVANKLYHPAEVDISIAGIPDNAYELQGKHLHFDTAGRLNGHLLISPYLPHGLYNVRIHASSDSGWSADFRIRHFAAGGS